MRARTSPPRGTRQISLIRNQFNRARDRNTLTGKIIFFTFIALVILIYSVVLIKVATRTAVDELKNSNVGGMGGGGGGGGDSGGGVFSPGQLFDDDRIGGGGRDRYGDMMDDFGGPGGIPESKNCTFPLRRRSESDDEEEDKDKDEAEAENEESNTGEEEEVGESSPVIEEEDGCYKDVNGRAVACTFTKMIMDISKLSLKAKGGEKISKVLGQEEEDEFIQEYEPGAFQLTKEDSKVPSIADLLFSKGFSDEEENLFFLRPLLSSMQDATALNGKASDLCADDKVVDTPTLFLTRYEYVNLKATLTDLFNAYGVSFGDPANKMYKKFNVVFLDAHPKGDFDEVWPKLFGGKADHVKHLKEKVTCFQKAIFVPAGYTSPIQSMYCQPVPSMLDSFMKKLLDAYDAQDVKMTKKKVLVIDRVGYVAHPRSDESQMKRVITNLADLKVAIERKIGDDADVQLVRPETMKFRDQVHLMRSAEVLVGKFGSGLSNLLFMDDDTFSLELDAESYNLYSGFADWKGPHHYHMQISTNIAMDENGKLDEETIGRIVDLVNTKVNCDASKGQRTVVEYSTVECRDDVVKTS